jgi:xylulokinase
LTSEHHDHEPVGDVTVGIDIGTTSVKALAVDEAGTVLARARVRHAVESPAADLFQHDANKAWRRNVRTAFRQVREGLDVKAVNVAAMVPSLCAVDRRGRPITPGLLYGDARGGDVDGKNPSESGEVVSFLRWCAREAPDAAGFWPAQAVANCALTGEGALDSVTAITTHPLFDYTAWDEAITTDAGATVGQLPRVVSGKDAVATIEGMVVGGGTVDALAEQIVAGADDLGDVLVILGTTLITWGVIPEWHEVPGLWTIPHSAPGKVLIGGASNGGGLFLNWALGLIGKPGATPVDPEGVPVWLPYLRGERTPLHDPGLRAALHDLDITHGPAALRRAAYEASAFVARRHIDLGGVPAQRIVATGGGTRVEPWVQALADCTHLPVDVVAVPEGGALGAAFMARVVAGLERSTADAARWVRTIRRVEPDDAWSVAVDRRYARFVELTEAAAGGG